MCKFILACDIVEPIHGKVVVQAGEIAEGKMATKVEYFLNTYPQCYELEETGGGYFEVSRTEEVPTEEQKNVAWQESLAWLRKRQNEILSRGI